jgi:glycosyltransferase involved in cell wall biosynthesis
MTTGLLAKVGDAEDLAQKIAWLAERPQERRRMGASARQIVLREYGSALQTERYVALYRRLAA